MDRIVSHQNLMTLARPRFASRFYTLRNRVRPSFRRGQSAVELALIAPLLIFVLVAATDFSRAYFMSIGAANAARAGVQYGAQSTTTASDTPGMKQAACADFGISNLSTCQTTLNPTPSNFCECPPSASHVSCSSTTCSGREMYVQVNTSAHFQTLLNYPGIPSTVSLNESALMRAE
jgi:Flp pilus assembly protein TadG